PGTMSLTIVSSSPAPGTMSLTIVSSSPAPGSKYPPLITSCRLYRPFIQSYRPFIIFLEEAPFGYASQ
ncbi:MAG: hypothetical protein JXR76_29655, partial [Deltaproteobacteria bacterium]|nr:hypothetical protein [Deltaproteobacteria bacterium]